LAAQVGVALDDPAPFGAAGSVKGSRQGAVHLLSTTTHDPHGTVLVDGVASFPIGLSPPPPAGSQTPAGGDALDEVVGAGISFLRVGPPRGHWNDEALADAESWNAAA